MNEVETAEMNVQSRCAMLFVAKFLLKTGYMNVYNAHVKAKHKRGRPRKA